MNGCGLFSDSMCVPLAAPAIESWSNADTLFSPKPFSTYPWQATAFPSDPIAWLSLMSFDLVAATVALACVTAQ